MRFAKYFFSIIILILFTSCASKQLVMRPISQSFINDNGYVIAYDRKDDVELHLEFDSEGRERYLFHFECYNDSDSPVYLDPETIYYIEYESLEDLNLKRNTPDKYPAFLYDEVVDFAREDIEDLKTRRKIGHMLEIAGFVAAVISHSNSNDNDVDWIYYNYYANAVGRTIDREVNYSNELEFLEEVKRNLSVNAMKKLIVPPKSNAYKILFFPSNHKHNYINILIYANDLWYSFIYKRSYE